MAMKEEDFEISVKVLVVGNGGVGKSSLIRRFCKDTFTDQYKKTIGVDFLEKQQYVPSVGETVTMMVCTPQIKVQFLIDFRDTAGQEEFDVITKNYYRGAGAAVLAFSTTDRASFEDVEKWRDKVAAECPAIPMVLMQNKVDLIDQALMSTQEAEELAKRLGLRFYRASVKENLNINQIFEYLAESYVTKANDKDSAPVVGTLDFSGETKVAATPRGPQQSNNSVVTLDPTPKKRTNGKKSKCSVL